MKNHFSVGMLASLVVVSCGGGSKGASSASSSSGDSQISMAFPAGDNNPAGKVDFSGVAFSQYDPDAKALLIYVLDPATQPAPSCDTVGLAAMMKQKSGTVATVVIKDFEGKATKLKAGLGLFAQGDTSALQSSPSAPLDATTVDITTYDAKTIDATIATDASSKATVSGKIHGTVCPNTSMQKQAQQVQDDQMAKMQANGGIPAVSDQPQQQQAFGGTAYQVQVGQLLMEVEEHSKALVKLDPKTKRLAIAAWPYDMATQPTCDLFDAPRGTNADTQYTYLFAKNVGARGPGKYTVYEVAKTFVGSDGPYLVATPHDGSIDVHQFDDKSFQADLSTTSKLILKGTVVADVCPNGAFAAPPPLAGSKPAKKGKTKK